MALGFFNYLYKEKEVTLSPILILILLLLNYSEDKVKSIFPRWSAQSFYRLLSTYPIVFYCLIFIGWIDNSAGTFWTSACDTYIRRFIAVERRIFTKTSYQYVFELRERLGYTIRIVKEELIKSKRKNKKLYDQNTEKFFMKETKYCCY